MKIKITKQKTETLIVDLEKERKHFEKNFKGEQFDRLWTIIEHAANDQWSSVEELIDKLEYDYVDHCPEVEFLPLWVTGELKSLFHRDNYEYISSIQTEKLE